jgi:hypothetical protein
MRREQLRFALHVFRRDLDIYPFRKLKGTDLAFQSLISTQSQVSQQTPSA